MCVEGQFEELTKVFPVVDTPPSYIFSKVIWRCNVFINVRSFYEGCDKMCVRADDRCIHKF